MPITKEHLLPKNVIPEETSTQSDEQPPSDGQSGIATSQVETRTAYAAKKLWVALKKASLTTKDNSSQKSPPTRKLQQTKMYASVDDLSPEYCGLPFVKKLKILNERQKLAELEKAVRSSSLDCGENEPEFDSNLTRSHSEACAIEYARKLAKYNQARQAAASSVEQLSPENETLERRNLKSILKKLSAGSSRAGSSETSATSTPDRQAATAELKRLMREPTIEGYAARLSRMSRSVTFNRYTLPSPPSEQPLQPPPSNSVSQDQPSLSPSKKLSFRSVDSAGILQTVSSRPREEECLGELLSGVGEVIKADL
ncbi:cyclic nucleotide-gated cation channel alpha-3, partial [Lasius niger]